MSSKNSSQKSSCSRNASLLETSTLSASSVRSGRNDDNYVSVSGKTPGNFNKSINNLSRNEIGMKSSQKKVPGKKDHEYEYPDMEDYATHCASGTASAGGESVYEKIYSTDGGDDEYGDYESIREEDEEDDHQKGAVFRTQATGTHGSRLNISTSQQSDYIKSPRCLSAGDAQLCIPRRGSISGRNLYPSPRTSRSPQPAPNNAPDSLLMAARRGDGIYSDDYDTPVSYKKPPDSAVSKASHYDIPAVAKTSQYDIPMVGKSPRNTGNRVANYDVPNTVVRKVDAGNTAGSRSMTKNVEYEKRKVDKSNKMEASYKSSSKTATSKISPHQRRSDSESGDSYDEYEYHDDDDDYNDNKDDNPDDVEEYGESNGNYSEWETYTEYDDNCVSASKVVKDESIRKAGGKKDVIGNKDVQIQKKNGNCNTGKAQVSTRNQENHLTLKSSTPSQLVSRPESTSTKKRPSSSNKQNESDYDHPRVDASNVTIRKSSKTDTAVASSKKTVTVLNAAASENVEYEESKLTESSQNRAFQKTVKKTSVSSSQSSNISQTSVMKTRSRISTNDQAKPISSGAPGERKNSGRPISASDKAAKQEFNESQARTYEAMEDECFAMTVAPCGSNAKHCKNAANQRKASNANSEKENDDVFKKPSGVPVRYRSSSGQKSQSTSDVVAVKSSQQSSKICTMTQKAEYQQVLVNSKQRRPSRSPLDQIYPPETGLEPAEDAKDDVVLSARKVASQSKKMVARSEEKSVVATTTSYTVSGKEGLRVIGKTSCHISSKTSSRSISTSSNTVCVIGDSRRLSTSSSARKSRSSTNSNSGALQQ